MAAKNDGATFRISRLRLPSASRTAYTFAEKFMQIISAQPLIESFRDGTFEESEVGAYFMAYMIFMAVMWIFAFGELNPWDIAAGVASVVITIFGVLHLKRQNSDSFGNQFLAKYFALGWVITVRMMLLAIPALVVCFAFASIVGGNDAFAPMGALFTIAFESLFYWWLGMLIAQANQTKSEQDSNPNA
jgi:hypothetical protein